MKHNSRVPAQKNFRSLWIHIFLFHLNSWTAAYSCDWLFSTKNWINLFVLANLIIQTMDYSKWFPFDMPFTNMIIALEQQADSNCIHATIHCSIKSYKPSKFKTRNKFWKSLFIGGPMVQFSFVEKEQRKLKTISIYCYSVYACSRVHGLYSCKLMFLFMLFQLMWLSEFGWNEMNSGLYRE